MRRSIVEGSIVVILALILSVRAGAQTAPPSSSLAMDAPSTPILTTDESPIYPPNLGILWTPRLTRPLFGVPSLAGHGRSSGTPTVVSFDRFPPRLGHEVRVVFPARAVVRSDAVVSEFAALRPNFLHPYASNGGSAFALAPWGSERYPGEPDHTGPYAGHYFIIEKAIEYLRRPEVNLLSGWPLESYAPYLYYGTYYADFPYSPRGLVCTWIGEWAYSGTCDALHHYRSGGDITEDVVAGTSIGGGGGLGAPAYAQVLYDLAVQFWPGGPGIPDLHSLPFRTTAGYMKVGFWDRDDFGPFVVGAQPFAYDTEWQCVQDSCGWGEGCIGPTIEAAYAWPGFLGTQWDENTCSFVNPTVTESERNALIYLGWAIHFVEDLSMPYHAVNSTGLGHKYFEEETDRVIHDNMYNLLPLTPGGKYSGNEVVDIRPSFFHNDWTVEHFADESARLAVDGMGMVAPIELWGSLGDFEMGLDTAIKMVAGVLYKFFTEINEPPVASAGLDQSSFVGESVHFDGNASYDSDGTIVGWAWDFGDGTPVSGGAWPAHTYWSPGVFTVTLTLTDNRGAVGTDTAIVSVRTVSDGISSLSGLVHSYQLAEGVTLALDRILGQAIAALAAPNAARRVDAPKELHAFINVVEGLRGKRLTGPQADELVAGASRLLVLM